MRTLPQCIFYDLAERNNYYLGRVAFSVYTIGQYKLCSCMPNVKAIINKYKNTPRSLYQYQGKNLQLHNMYKATLTSNQDTYQRKIYYGITKTKFKWPYTNRIKSLRHETYQSNTELSNKLWSIKNKNCTLNLIIIQISKICVFLSQLTYLVTMHMK